MFSTGTQKAKGKAFEEYLKTFLNEANNINKPTSRRFEP